MRSFINCVFVSILLCCISLPYSTRNMSIRIKIKNKQNMQFIILIYINFYLPLAKQEAIGALAPILYDLLQTNIKNNRLNYQL